MYVGPFDVSFKNQQENKRQHTTLFSKAALSHEENTPSERTLPNHIHGSNMEQTNTFFNNAQSTYPT